MPTAKLLPLKHATGQCYEGSEGCKLHGRKCRISIFSWLPQLHSELDPGLQDQWPLRMSWHARLSFHHKGAVNSKQSAD